MRRRRARAYQNKTSRSVIRAIGTAVLVAAPVVSQAAIPQAQIQTVALTNTDGPLGPQLGSGVFFSEFGSGALNSLGDMGFYATLTGAGVGSSNDQGDWLSISAVNNAIARTGTDGDLGPGMGVGVTFRSLAVFGSPQVNDQGMVVFNGYSNQTPGNSIWEYTRSENTAIAMAQTDGPLGPNVGFGETFILAMPSTQFIADDKVIFSHYIYPPDPNVGGQAGVWEATSSGGPSVIARSDFTGTLGPALGDDTVYTGFSQIIQNRSHDITFNASLSNPDTSFSGGGLVHVSSTGNSLLALTGTDGALGPNLGPGVTFTSLRTTQSISSDQFLSHATVTGSTLSTDGLWRIDPSSITALALGGTDGALGPQMGSGTIFARSTDGAAGGGPVVGSFAGHEQNFAFLSQLSGGGYDPNSSGGLWMGSGNEMVPVALIGTSGALGPGLDPDSIFKSFTSLAMTDDNSVFFTATTGVVGETTWASGLWQFQGGHLVSVIQAGDSLAPDPANPSVTKTVSSVGTNLSLDPVHSRLAVNLSFTDGTSGLFLMTAAGSGQEIAYWRAGDNASWSGGPWSSASVPDGVGAFAVFGNADGGAGNHTVNVDGNYTIGTLFLNNQNSSYLLSGAAGARFTLDNDTRPSAITDAAGSHQIDVPLTMTSNGMEITVSTAADHLTISSAISGNGAGLTKLGPGTLILSGENSYSGGTNVVAGTMVIGTGNALAAGALSIADGARVNFLESLGKTVSISSLAIIGNGSLDMANNSLLISYTGASPVQTIRGYLLAGFNAGNWNGLDGIDSSVAAANAHHSTTLGYLDNGSQVEIKYTWLGDTNLDGVVNGLDFSALSPSGTTWATGDFNYDGVVNADDYALFMLSAAYGSVNISATLPEPSGALAMIGLLGSSLFTRRLRGGRIRG